MKAWIGVAVLAAGAAFGYRHWQRQFVQPQGDSGATSSAMARVEARDIQIAVKASGEIGPAEQVSVRPEINGRIAQFKVDVGDQVKKGDLLFKLDDTDLQIERTSRLTEIDVAALLVERTQRDFERAEKLFGERLISKEVFDNTKTDYALAKKNHERAEAALRLVEDRLSKTEIVAPFDCSVLTRPVSVGQAVSGAAGFNSGTEVLTVANLQEMIVLVHINQADIPRVNAGQEVTVEVESVKGLGMKGVIERVAPQATLKNGLRGYAVRVALKAVDPRVRPGMTANVSMPIESASNAVAVPLAAIVTEREGRFVYVKHGAGFEKRIIDLGVFNYDFAEVRSGLALGDVVALDPPKQLTRDSSAKSGKPEPAPTTAAKDSSRR
ncbi:MAG: efflux RND transporter periplasmic adaptor subunit [Verrucomicrobia bacterium]|nr:efflux RND transporter periplasmic adaptor subunit [Verrucomicrobiota bacterium]